jgi:hypothetical protein
MHVFLLLLEITVSVCQRVQSITVHASQGSFTSAHSVVQIAEKAVKESS